MSMLARPDGARQALARGRLQATSFVVVCMVRLALCFFPYRILRRFVPRAAGRTDSRFYARRVAASVRTAASWVPGASCLTQTLAAQYLLARSGHQSAMRIGVRKEANGSLTAHAWLLCEGAVVLGGSEEELASYAPLTDLD